MMHPISRRRVLQAAGAGAFALLMSSVARLSPRGLRHESGVMR